MARKIGTLLLTLLLTALGLAAQTRASAPKTDTAAPAPETTPKPGVAPQDAAGGAEPKPADPAASVSTSASASFSPLPQEAAAPEAVPEANTELRSQVQEALAKDPSLSKCSIIIAASADGIDLTGSAGSSRERLAAWRLAESYARGKKVENHIVVNGQGGATAPAAGPDGPKPAPSPNPAPASPASSATSPGKQNNRE